MWKQLSKLEQLLMDHVWAHPDCTADACQQALAAASRPLKDSTVRTLLHRLEVKGYVTHRVSGRTYIYRASKPRNKVAAQAVRQIVDRFCDGSMEQLLVGMVDNDFLSQHELQQLARRIDLAKKERM